MRAGEFSVAAIRGAELKLKGDDSCSDASGSPVPLVTSYSASPSPVSARAQRPGRGALSASSNTLPQLLGARGSTASSTWLGEDDVLTARLPPITQVSNLGVSLSQSPSPVALLLHAGMLSLRFVSLVSLQRSDSLASVYSGAGEGRYGTVAVRGEVEFGLQYNYKEKVLEIHIVQCRDLAPVDAKRNRSDP